MRLKGVHIHALDFIPELGLSFRKLRDLRFERADLMIEPRDIFAQLRRQVIDCGHSVRLRNEKISLISSTKEAL